MKSILSFVLMLLVMMGTVQAQSLPSPAEVIEKSIAYHDPGGAWYSSVHMIALEESRPNGPSRFTDFELDYPADRYEMSVQRGDDKIEASVGPDGCSATINGSAEISEELEDRYRLSCEGIAWWKSYYEYMHGMPMKLKDPGTVLDPEVKMVQFMDEEVVQIKVTYDAEVGADIWYFYFNPETYAIVGSRFYHDEAANDGEYIPFEGEVEAGGIKLPKSIIWYTNKDGRHLGTDTITAYSRN